MNNESKTIDLEALSQLLDLDIAADAARSQKEIDQELKRRGFDLDKLNRSAADALRNSLKCEPAPTTNSAGIVGQTIAAREVVAAKIRWYCDLLFHQPQFATGGNLASDTTANEEKAREIVLAKEFTEAELNRIPWAGPKVKLSKIVEAGKGTAIIAGHGKTSESGFPLIEVADGILSEEDWIKLSDYRIVVLHSCFGGHVMPGYLGDLGGLIGLTLGGQTKLLCAPVAEVPVEAALTLNEHHGKADGSREFGLRYLNALAENPTVGRYNLYGLPTERIGKSRRVEAHIARTAGHAFA